MPRPTYSSCNFFVRCIWPQTGRNNRYWICRLCLTIDLVPIRFSLPEIEAQKTLIYGRSIYYSFNSCLTYNILLAFVRWTLRFCDWADKQNLSQLVAFVKYFSLLLALIIRCTAQVAFMHAIMHIQAYSKQKGIYLCRMPLFSNNSWRISLRSDSPYRPSTDHAIN